MALPFTHPFQETQFDIFEWHPKFQSCLRFFLDHAQYEAPVQAVCALVNIRLPHQKPRQQPPTATSNHHHPSSGANLEEDPNTTLLLPYIRRLVATAFDTPSILFGFFGDDWAAGIGPMHEQERRNYLFAAKSDSWLAVKNSYDMGDGQTIPFLRPLRDATGAEIEAAEQNWSQWLAMQDWMIGPHDPAEARAGSRTGPRAQRN